MALRQNEWLISVAAGRSPTGSFALRESEAAATK